MRTNDLPVIGPEHSLLDVLRLLNASGLEIALVVDDGALVGVVTDGDVRQALVAGRGLEFPVRFVMKTQYRSVAPSVSRAEVLDMMTALRIKAVPVVGARRNLLGLHLLNDMVAATARPNRALIVCGGMGTRLRPITEAIPKPMIPVAGRPILERLVLHMVGLGFRSIHLAIHYLGNQIEAHFGNGEGFGCAIEYIRETTPLGTGGSFALLPDGIAEPILVMNGDLVTQFDMGRLVDFHVLQGNDATLGIRAYSHQVPFGVIESRGGLVIALQEKPILNCTINAGIYVLNPELRQLVQSGHATTLPDILERCLRSGGKVGMLPVDEDWIDVGRHEELMRARGETVPDPLPATTRGTH